MRVIVSALFTKTTGEILVARQLKENKYTTPGGKVEEGESLIDALKREVAEETSLKVLSADLFCYIEATSKLIVVYNIRDYIGEPQQTEPNKHGLWVWKHLDKIHHCVTEGLRHLYFNNFHKVTK